eukprot:CAMPEP_0185755082 /NCGR_PEP_ID=MMETSP1174-20130828/13627_1 /TAXON_ID=35687 /ORGANISM="Dictyocha speculum, Strain CCMP1381" /LENGTH=72 /DNA_ID=CAMNT_0028433511 /DNA_START=373 /DNA_END=587 /DNA_ORIENTATION=-
MSPSAFTPEMSWGVMKMNWRWLNLLPWPIKLSIAVFRLTASMKTSNSSMIRKGLSMHSPNESNRATVTEDRS